MHIIPICEESEEELKSPSMRMKEESEKAGLKLNIQKVRSWHPVPSLHANRKGKSGSSDRFYFLRLQKSLRTVTAAMKLKDTYTLEGKL